MSKTFFIGDLHIGHKNILRFDNRPYFTVDECAEDIVNRWNNKVANSDTVVVAGDFFWSEEYAKNYLPQLKGNIIVVEGNHDHRWITNKTKCTLIPYFHNKIFVNGISTWVYVSHQYTPFYLHQYNNGVHLYAHSHTTKECFDEWALQEILRGKGYNQRCYNVGCMHEYMLYEPRTIEEIEDQVRKKELIL